MLAAFILVPNPYRTPGRDRVLATVHHERRRRQPKPCPVEKTMQLIVINLRKGRAWDFEQDQHWPSAPCDAIAVRLPATGP
ncbi:hypothetical protein EVAR_53944_1 [Eumeta japonica]|uniref:Uncharacterized protein n=1 Tax=Eumeta variegata TaxID=151549 RepID=A0A4C1ZD69_EUMVA|nr:hypothetical protein EVAR_53944_1 [Eumeta japonica]